MGRAAADLPGGELRVEGFVLRVDLQRRVDLFATRVDQRNAIANGYSTRAEHSALRIGEDSSRQSVSSQQRPLGPSQLPRRRRRRRRPAAMVRAAPPAPCCNPGGSVRCY